VQERKRGVDTLGSSATLELAWEGPTARGGGDVLPGSTHGDGGLRVGVLAAERHGGGARLGETLPGGAPRKWRCCSTSGGGSTNGAPWPAARGESEAAWSSRRQEELELWVDVNARTNY
jgi:hypothetical protein